jgi:hypothetical protein
MGFLFVVVWVEVGATKILSIPSSVYIHFVMEELARDPRKD